MKVIKTDIQIKYDLERDNINHGDIILVKSRKLIGRLISECDNDAYHTHAMIARIVDGRVEIVHSTFGGIKPAYLSHLIPHYVDFNIYRPLLSGEKIKDALFKTTYRGSEKKIDYDYAIGIRELIRRKYNVDINNNIFGFSFGSQDADICSEFIYTYLIHLGFTEYQIVKIFFPEDLVRYMNENHIAQITKPLLLLNDKS